MNELHNLHMTRRNLDKSSKNLQITFIRPSHDLQFIQREQGFLFVLGLLLRESKLTIQLLEEAGKHKLKR